MFWLMYKRNKMVFFSIPAWYLSWVVFKLRPEDKISKLAKKNVAHVLILFCLPVYLDKGKHHYLKHESKDQKINCTSGKKDIRCKDRVEKYHENHGIYRCMFSLYLLRVLDKMFIVLLKEMYLGSKKLIFTKKHCTDLKTTKMPWTAKERKWSKYSLKYFDPDKEDIKAEDPSGIICQLKQ